MFGIADCYGLQNSGRTIQQYMLTWGEVSPLVFSGIPNQIQTREITYTIHTDNKCKRYWLNITGSPFSNGDVVLDTVYWSGNDKVWYKAGESFVVQGAVGEVKKLKYQATSGPNISSQRAGAYTAKITITLLSLQ